MGTVKSRLARGRERLRGRLIRRGFGPEEGSGLPTGPAVAVPATLARATAEAMLRFAAGRPIVGVASTAALSWTLRTLRIMRMTRIAIISSLLIAGLAATGAAMRTLKDRTPAPVAAAGPAKAAEPPGTARAAGPEKTAETLSVRVVDAKGRGAPDVEVKVIESDARPGDDAAGSRSASYRTGADGRVRIAVDPLYERLALEARPDDRTFG